MGTRADFYVGRGEKAEWLGSIALDGYPDGFDDGFFDCADEAHFREKIAAYISGRRDGTKPEQGWPWPWDTSATTDFAYAWDAGRVFASCFGDDWFNPTDYDKPDFELPDNGKTAVFPDMSARKNVTMGSRSGLMVFTSKGT